MKAYNKISKRCENGMNEKVLRVEDRDIIEKSAVRRNGSRETPYYTGE